MTINMNTLAQQIFVKLSEKDGQADDKIGLKADGSCDKSIWNTFADVAGGQKIKRFIAKDNAIKSITVYLQRAKDNGLEAFNNILNYMKMSTIENEAQLYGEQPLDEEAPVTTIPGQSDDVIGELKPEDESYQADTEDVQYHNHNGNMPSRVITRDGDGNITETTTMEYDDQNRMVSYAKVYNDNNCENGECRDFTENYTYSSDGNTRSTVATDSYGNIIAKYDEQVGEDGAFSGVRQNEFEYEYDNAGRLVAMTEKSPDGKDIVTKYEHQPDGTVIATTQQGEGAPTTQTLTADQFSTLLAGINGTENPLDNSQDIASNANQKRPTMGLVEDPRRLQEEMPVDGA